MCRLVSMCGIDALVTLSPPNPSLQSDLFRFPIMDLLGEVKNEVKRRLSQIEVMNDEYLICFQTCALC